MSNQNLKIGVGLGTIAILILAILGIWYFRPWFQGTVYLLYTTPMAWIAVVATLAILIYGLRNNVGGTLETSGVMFIILIAVFGGITGLIAAENLSTQTMDNTQVADSLPETDAEQPRVVTKSVADRYASNTLNYPQYTTTRSEITIHNGTPQWSYALAPDGLWNHFTKKQHGTVMVDMTEQNADVQTFESDMNKGVGTAFYNHYKWKTLKKSHYLVDYKDPFMVVHNESQYVATPYTKPNFHLTPIPHTTPEWGGVVLVDKAGNVEDLSPQEAQNHEALADRKLYPFDLAKQKVASTKYRNGIINTWTSHEGEIEVAPVPGENNDQPFMVLTEDGPKYMVAVEPYGEAQGLREIWMVDGRTGEYERYETNGSLFGPRKATDYVRQAARTTDWDRFNPSEPIPVVVNDQLYWEVRVVPQDNSGISYIAFVNAESSDVAEVETTSEVSEFLRGETPTNSTREESSTREPSLIVQRVGENGSVIDTLNIYKNESVSITQSNQTINATG